jgi:hypothetical protein
MRRPVLELACAGLFCLACGDTPDPVAIADGADTPRPRAGAGIASLPATLLAPVFDLGIGPDGSVLAAETLVGVTSINNGNTRVLSPLGGVTGVVFIGSGRTMAVTGEAAFDPAHAPNAKRLFEIRAGQPREVANLEAFEFAVNPDQIWNSAPPESNPFNIAHLTGKRVLVADAAGNSILHVDGDGVVDWVAILTPHLVPTRHFRELIGCFDGNSGAPECGLPLQFLAQPVATSIAIGPDGAYYAGELTGFPSPPGFSRIWRIAPGSRHVVCPSASCTQVATGLTSIMDMFFGPSGTLYVVEFDRAGWLAVEVRSGGGPLMPVRGGTVKACNVATGVCTIHTAGLALPSAITVASDGTIWIAENAAIPFGTATVRELN